MFKLFFLAAFFAVAVAYSGHLSASPLVYSASGYLQGPAYGSVVGTIPTSVSHQSISRIHSSPHYVQPIVAPLVRSTYATPYSTYNAAAPVYRTYAAAPVVHRYNVAPIYKSYDPSYATAYSQWRK